MFERFTDRARKVMALANQEAQRFNHEYIDTEHILLGMVKGDPGVGVNLLKHFEIDLPRVRLEVEKLIANGLRAGTNRMPLMPRAKRVLELAIIEARGLGHNYVGTEHLLLGLIGERDGIAGQLLAQLNLRLDEVRKATRYLVGDGLFTPEAMAESATPRSGRVDSYGANYRNFDQAVYADIRRAAFGEDIGQNSWLTATEQDKFLGWLGLTADSQVLDVACGTGGPTLRIARTTGAHVQGVDIHLDGIAAAQVQAQQQGLADLARFEVVDATMPLPFPDAMFDALVCIDAINHLPDRPSVLSDWSRILRPGGRMLFTDPVVVTGPVTSEELAVRSSIGFFLFVPPHTNNDMIAAAGLRLILHEDVTENIAETAEKRHNARADRAEQLQRIEGAETYEGQQRFYHVAAKLARERRLSRLVYVAEKPSAALDG